MGPGLRRLWLVRTRRCAAHCRGATPLLGARSDALRGEPFMKREVIKHIKEDLRSREVLIREFDQLLADREILYKSLKAGKRLDKTTHPLPMNVARLIVNAQRRFSIDRNKVWTA